MTARLRIVCTKRGALLLLTAGLAALISVVLWAVGASSARAGSLLTLTYDANATCPVANTPDCSYATVDAALKSAITDGTAQWSLNLPGLDVAGNPTISGAGVVDDGTLQSLVISGTLNVAGGMPVQVTAVWAGDATPKLALVIQPPDGALAALNSVWSSSADPQVTGVRLLTSPDASYSFDPAQLPETARSFYPAGFTPREIGSAVSLFAGINVGATADRALKNVLTYLGVGDTATISGTLSDSVGAFLDGSKATGAEKGGLDLTLSSTTSGAPLPSWIDSRTTSIEFKLGASDVPAVTFTDTLQTTLDGQPNTFTGTFDYNPAAEGGTSISVAYEVASSNTFNAPFGLGALQLSDTKLTLSATLGDTPQYAADLSSTVSLNTKTFVVTAHLGAGDGALNGDISVTGSVSVSDAVALGNQLAGTSAALDGGSVGDDLALTGVQFSFATASGPPADKRFALTASTSFRGATANAVVSLDKSGSDPVKLFVGIHVANLDFTQLVGQTSSAFSGLAFPSVNLFVSKGYLTDGNPTDVAWSDLLPAEQTFFTSVYGPDALPDKVTFGPTLTFDGTMTLPDAIATRFGVTDPIQLSGSLGFGLNTLGDATPPALAGTLTAVLPSASAGLPDWMSNVGPWTITISADSNKSVSLAIDGTVSATVAGGHYDVDVSGAVSKQGSDYSFELTGTVKGTFDNLFGISWLSVTDPTVKLAVEKGESGTTFTASLETDVVLGGTYTLHVVADVSNKDGTSASLTLTSVDSAATISLNDVASFFGAASSDLPNLPFSVTLNSLQARVSVASAQGGTTVSIDVVADTTVTLGGNAFSSTQLLSITKPAAGAVQVVLGFKPAGPVNLSDIIGSSNLPSGVDFTFPSFALVVAHPAVTLKFDDLLPAEQDFFQPFCGKADSACHDKLQIADGISVVSATSMPDDLTGVLDKLNISHDAPVLVTGTIPFSSGGAFDLKVSLPKIPAAGPDFYAGGQLSLEISSIKGLSFNGTMTFNIPKGSSVTNEADCTAEGGVWRIPNGGSSEACYDQVPFTLSAGVNISDGIDLTLVGGLDPSYTWMAPMGQTWLTLNRATLEFRITIGESVQFGLGFDIAATVAGHDFSGSILASLVPGPPLGLNPNLEGFRIASGSGLSAQDLVDFANAAGAHISLQNAKLPNIAVRNILVSYSQTAAPELCLAQGIHIAGDLYINPGADAQTVSSADCGKDAVDRAQICKDDASQGCLVGVDVAISDTGVRAHGVLAGFTAGPLDFKGAEVDLEIGGSTQHLLIAGQASIQGFADGSVDLLVSPTAAHFRGSMALFGSGLDAYIDGSAAVNITNLSDLENVASFSITAVLKGEWLNEAGVAISGTLSKLKPVIVAIGNVIQDLNNGDVLGAMFELPVGAAQLGVTLPEPWGSAFATISKDFATIRDGLSALGHPFSYALNDVLNGFTLSFPGIPGVVVPRTCVITEQDGQCWTTPPWHTIFGTVPGIPGYYIPETCVGTVVNGTCYTVPPITGVHIPGICNDLQGVISGLTCDQNGIADDLLLPALKALLKETIGYDIGNVSLSSALQYIEDAIGAGKTFAISCAEFQASATLGTNPNANVSLSADVNFFGTQLTPQISWNFAPDSSNVLTDIQEILDAIVHPSATGHGSCGLPADWNTNPDFPDVVNTADVTTPVLPQPPTMTVNLTNPTIDEGGTAQLSGTITPAPASPQQVTIDWADGTTSTSTAGTDGNFTASHGYPDNKPDGRPSGQYLVTATSGQLTASAALTVANVAPGDLVASASASSINEGDHITVSGSFTDPGADSHTVTIDWGDGSTSSIPLAVGTLNFTSPAHTYVDNNGANPSYPVKVTVADDDFASVSTTLTENVANVAPGHVSIAQLAAAGATCPDAGCPLTTDEQQAQTFHFAFTDPGVNDTVSAVIDWGDGTSDNVPLGTNRAFNMTHVWTEADTADHPDGKLPLSVQLTDKDGGTGSGTATETVNNVAPSQLSVCLVGTVTDAHSSDVCPQTATINEGDTVKLFGAFTDPSSADTHTVKIDWGPGWPADERYQTIDLPVGTLGYNATRQFGDEDAYPITVTVTDDDGASTSATSTLTVNNVAPTAGIDRSAATTVQSVPLMLTHVGTSTAFSASSTDPGNDPLTATWNWQDGTSATTVHPGIAETSPENPHVAPQSITDPRSHTWTSACVYPVTYTVDDGDGGKTTDEMDVVVTGNARQWTQRGEWAEQYAYLAALSARHVVPRDRYSIAQVQTLSCYLQIAQRMSAVFDGPASKAASAPIPLLSFADAASILRPQGQQASDPRVKLRASILSWWLNFASGAVDYNDLLPAHPGFPVFQPQVAFNSVMATAEQLALDPAASAADLRREWTYLLSLHGD